MPQEQGIIGKFVGGMIRRSVRARFHTVYWRSPAEAIDTSVPHILYANHHGWMDGYLMFHLITKLGLNCLDWIEEFDAFPLFRFVGGMPFRRNDAVGRATTVRKTLRAMNDKRLSLILFPEGVMHRPPSLLPLGRSIQVVAQHVAGVRLAPVAIRYELSQHERPVAWMSVGSVHAFESIADCQNRLQSELDSLDVCIDSGERFDELVRGTHDVNERFSMRGPRR